MRILFQVTKAELRNLFYSPVAWFLLVAFMAQCAWFYSVGLIHYTNLQDLYVKNDPNFIHWENEGFTRVFFLGDDGVFMNVFRNLYLFIPLLTMGLIGREVQSGTIKLLFSSPLKLRQIVLGKFLAIILFIIALMLVLGIFMISAAIQIKDVDYGMLISAVLGFFLLTAAYAAIGTFMSSLTTYPVVAALGTFIIILILTTIGGLWQQYDVVRDLTYFLNISGRTEHMAVGLITTKDLFYFIIIITMFLSFTILKLKAARSIKPWYIKMMRYAVVFSSCLLVGYISSRPSMIGYWDTTAQRVNTLDPKTQQIIKDMGEEPLEVTLYTNLVGLGMQAGLPQYRNIYLNTVWDRVLRFKPDIKFNYEYYYDYDSTLLGDNLYKGFPGKDLDGIAKQMAELYEIDFDYWKTPEQIRMKINLRPESFRLVMQLKYKNRTSFLRTFDDMVFWPDERQMAAALKKLVLHDVPQIGFITGHYERSIYKKGEREYAFHTAATNHRSSLINDGFDLVTLDLDIQDIPDDITLLVLADPKSELSVKSRERISKYLQRGGNMMFLGEPKKQHILNPVLEQIGVQLLDGLILTGNKKNNQDVLSVHDTYSMISMSTDPSRTSLDYTRKSSAGTSMTTVAALNWADTAGFTARTLFTTHAGGTWLRNRPFVRDSARVFYQPESGDLFSDMINFPSTEPSELLVATTEMAENAENHAHAHNHHGKEDNNAAHMQNHNHGVAGFATCMAFYKTINNKDQRIIVAGDADWISNSGHGAKYVSKMYSWLNNGLFPIFFEKKEPKDTLLLISNNSAEVFRMFFLWILTGILVIVGTVLLIRRKRK